MATWAIPYSKIAKHGRGMRPYELALAVQWSPAADPCQAAHVSAAELSSNFNFVRETGVEPARLAALEPKSGHSEANWANGGISGGCGSDGWPPLGLVQGSGRQLGDN